MTRSHPEFLLEHTGEILRILESQGIGDLGNAAAGQQQGLGLLHHKMADELRSTLAGFHTDQIAKVIGRKE